MKIIMLSMVLLFFGCSQNKKMVVDSEIDYSFEFDLDSYLGVWYEVARYDHSFERGLQGVTATYSLLPNGKIKVLNQGFKNSLDGELKTAVGKAKIPNVADLRRLKVSFFLFFYSDYYILELDEDYTYAVIGSKSSNYLWILSRTPRLDDQTKEMLLSKIKSRGYEIEPLIWVKHL